MAVINGTTGNDNLVGTSGVDTISGLDGNDTMDGAAGSDRLVGGLGDDVYIVDSAFELTIENASEGTDEVRTVGAIYTTLQANIESLTYTGASNFTGTGNTLNNVITGNGGNDTLTGGQGADTINGGGGVDAVTYFSSVGVNLATGVHTGEAAGDIYNSIEIIQGAGGHDTLTGDSSANNLQGGLGNDLIDGGAGGDTLNGGGGVDTLTYANAPAGISVNLATGLHTGDAAGDVISQFEIFQGTAFNDTFTSSTTAETFRGGVGNDIYVLDQSADVVVENASEGTDEVRVSAALYTLSANVENLTYVGATAFAGNGNVDNNVITGGTGADTLTGAAGADTLNGGGGIDTANYTLAVSVNLATGVHTGDAAGDVFSSIEFIQGSANADTLMGDAGANGLRGGAGNDQIEGGAGADTLDGGNNVDTLSYAGSGAGVSVNLVTGVHTGDAAGDVITGFEIFQGSAFNDTFTSSTAAETFRGGTGNDVYVLDQSTDVVTENASEGADEVRASSATYVLSANLENLTYVGVSTFTGTGNAINNVITGGTGNDTLIGGAGADTLMGGNGTDVAAYGLTSVTVNLATGIHTGDAAGDVFTSIEVIQGSSANDILVGDSSSNNLNGWNGNDILEGAGGADTLSGGNGTDYADYSHATSGMSLNLSTGTHTGEATGDQFSGVEGFIGTGFADTLTGGAANEIFVGGAGADLIDGGGGTTNIASYYTSASAITADLGASTVSGSDATGDTITNIQGIYGTNFNDSLLGNGSDNHFEGGWGDDTINGGAGNDIIHGYARDVLSGQVPPSSTDQNDSLMGGNGDDSIYSGFNDYGTVAVGGDGSDTIQVQSGVAYGDAGGDYLYGLGNNYQVYGGTGADTITAGGFSQSGVTYNGYIEGGDGGDQYFFSAASGNIEVVENGPTGSDSLVMGNVLAADVRYQNAVDGVSIWITSATDLADGTVDNGILLYGYRVSPTVEHFYGSDGIEFFITP